MFSFLFCNGLSCSATALLVPDLVSVWELVSSYRDFSRTYCIKKQLIYFCRIDRSRRAKSASTYKSVHEGLIRVAAAAAVAVLCACNLAILNALLLIKYARVSGLHWLCQ